ncbi:hypothetical protein [Arthrobacter sp. N199823]|uniref:hypothetical protein n=1 Tax=Arthrobacter sp. N199823 TaxID=2058895 RepID=UPI0011AFEBAB|nr:hypothetical protein [Arthrobacter sp. N199823]
MVQILRNFRLIALIVALGLTGCTTSVEDANPTRGAASKAPTLDVVTKAMEKMNCEYIDILENDIQSFDDMSGAECVVPDISSLIVRIYATPGTPYKILDEWGPGLSAENQLMYSDTWIAIGKPDELTRIFDSYSHIGPTTEIPTPVAQTPPEIAVSECTIYASTSIVSAATTPDTYAASINHIDEIYPGMKSLIETNITEKDLVKIRDLNTNAPARLEAFLSTFGASIKSFCRSMPTS